MTPAPVGYQCPECVREAARTAPHRRVRVRFLLGRPGSMTTMLLVVNIAMFVVEVAVGGTRTAWGGTAKLIDLGAMYPPAVVIGHQYWRLITVMFLHAGIIHLALNMYALYLFGYLIENAFGKVRFLAIYFVSGFIASAVSFAFGPLFEVGVGASGAIFGLLGAWVAYNYRRRGTAMAEANLRGAIMLIVLNVVLGFSIPGIDWRAHLGGLAAGLIAGALAEGFGPRETRTLVQVGGMAALVLAGIALTAWRVSTFPTLGGL
jgi:membrane associated rhomboid family serine protease